MSKKFLHRDNPKKAKVKLICDKTGRSIWSNVSGSLLDGILDLERKLSSKELCR